MQVVITDPALDSGMDKSLWVDISQSRGRIQVEKINNLLGINWTKDLITRSTLALIFYFSIWSSKRLLDSGYDI